MRLRTLGGLALEGGNFERTKPLLLLCYLALEGPKERRHLAELFWLGAANPLGSLSTALSQIRQGAPGSFEADQVKVWTELESDAKELLAALEKGELEKALGLYQGRFLDGVFLQDWGAELEEWVYRTREVLAGQARKALLRIAEAEASKGRFERAAKGAEQAYLLSGAPEPEPEELERLYTLMLAGGSSQAAEVRKEADSFGLTLQLSASEAKERLVSMVAVDHPTPHNLPGRGTSFVGRDLELTEVTNLLMKPACQLLTLIGPGGVGKTRLALQVAGELLKQGQFKDGVYFVALDALTAPSLVPLNLATTLGVHLQAQDEPLSQVIHWIGDKHLLLVLDNFEHLVEGATAAAELLQRCPNLKLLVTSRERLNLEEEWTFLVEGLAYPRVDVSFIDAQHYEALKFFTLRSNRTHRTFSLTSDNLPEVVRICRLVDGTPLGIELAATWVRLMPVREIAQEIEKNVDFLAAEMRDTPERHRSLRATFEHSWTLLSERERQVLRRLSVFRGGFKREAASAVVGATLPVLASLMDKSLLRVSSSGRYDRHPLLHQFMEEKLAEQQDEAKEYREKHAQYYLAFVAQQDDALTGGPKVKQAAEAIEEELPNLRPAWSWAVENQELEAIKRVSETLVQFADIKSFYHQVAEFTQQALEGLNEANPEHHLTLGTLKAAAGVLNYRIGNNEQTLQDCLKAVELLEPHQAGSRNAGLWAAWLTAGQCSWTLGSLEEAKDYSHRGLSVARSDLEGAAGDPVNTKYANMRIGVSLHTLGLIHFYYGHGKDDYDKANEYFLEGIKKDLEAETAFVCEAYAYLGEFYLFQENLSKAQETLEEGLRIAQQINFTTQAANIACVLAKVHLAAHKYEEATAICHEVSRRVSKSGDKLIWVESSLSLVQGWIALEQGNLKQAEVLFRMSAQASFSVHSVVFGMEAVLGLSKVWMKNSALEEAEKLLGFLIGHPATSTIVKKQAQSLVEALEEQQGSELVAEALERGRTLSLEQVAAILAQPLPTS